MEYHSLRRSEASLPKLLSYISEHDTGIMTACRRQVIDDETGNVIDVTKSQNEMRARQLFSELNGRYAIVTIKGACIENGGEQNELEIETELFCAVNVTDLGWMEDDLRRLGQKWDQDSILFVPRGGEKGILWGTNLRLVDKDVNLPYGCRIILENPVLDGEGHLIERCKGRPFVFESVGIEYAKRPRMGFFSELPRHLFMQRDWRDGPPGSR